MLSAKTKLRAIRMENSLQLIKLNIFSALEGYLSMVFKRKCHY